MGMTEILSALLLLGGIEDPNGNPPTTKAMAEAFEQLFDFHFNSIYDCQGELYRRKPCNLTKTLDAMKGALMKEYKRKENGKSIRYNLDVILLCYICAYLGTFHIIS